MANVAVTVPGRTFVTTATTFRSDPNAVTVQEASAKPGLQWLLGFCFLVVTAVGWGVNWPITKLLLRECPPLTARGISGVVACSALLGLALARREVIVVRREYWPRIICTSLLNVTAWMGLTTLSLNWLSAGKAATLAYTMPVWAAVLARPLLGELLTLRKIAALLLSLAGVIMVIGSEGVAIARTEFPGICLAISAAALFAFGTVMSKRWPLKLPPITLTAWQVGIGSLPLLGLSLIAEQPHLAAMPWFGWAAIAYTAAASLGICYLTWFAALRRLPASTAAIGTLLTPIVGVAASTFVFNEPLLPSLVIALGLVGSGIVLSARNTGSRQVR